MENLLQNNTWNNAAVELGKLTGFTTGQCDILLASITGLVLALSTLFFKKVISFFQPKRNPKNYTGKSVNSTLLSSVVSELRKGSNPSQNETRLHELQKFLEECGVSNYSTVERCGIDSISVLYLYAQLSKLDDILSELDNANEIVLNMNKQFPVYFNCKLQNLETSSSDRAIETHLLSLGIDPATHAKSVSEGNTTNNDANGPAIIKRRTFQKHSSQDEFSGVNNTTHLSGWLQKRKSRRLPMWNSRFFRVGTNYLQYFADEQEARKNNLLAAIDLRQVSAVRFETKDNGAATDFVLQLPKGRLFRLRASTPTIASKWVSGLNIALSKLDTPVEISSTSLPQSILRQASSLVPWRPRGRSMHKSSVNPLPNITVDTQNPQSILSEFERWARKQVYSTFDSLEPSSIKQRNSSLRLSKTLSMAKMGRLTNKTPPDEVTMKRCSSTPLSNASSVTFETMSTNSKPPSNASDITFQEFYLLQHLKSCKFSLDEAKQLWTLNWQWRINYFSLHASKGTRINSPVNGAMERKSLLSSIREAWSSEWVGYDYAGNPVEYFTPARLNSKLYSLSKLGLKRFGDNVMRVFVDINERHLVKLRDLSEREGRPITSSTIIVDLADFATQSDHFESVMLLKKFCTMVSEHYPQRFANILMVRPSWQCAAYVSLFEDVEFSNVYIFKDTDYISMLLKFMPGSSIPSYLCGVATIAA